MARRNRGPNQKLGKPPPHKKELLKELKLCRNKCEERNPKHLGKNHAVLPIVSFVFLMVPLCLLINKEIKKAYIEFDKSTEISVNSKHPQKNNDGKDDKEIIKLGIYEITSEDEKVVARQMLVILFLTILRSYFSMWFLDESYWLYDETVTTNKKKLWKPPSSKWKRFDILYRMSAVVVLYIGALSFPCLKFKNFVILKDYGILKDYEIPFEYFILTCYLLFLLWDILALTVKPPEIRASRNLKWMVVVWLILDLVGSVVTALYLTSDNNSFTLGNLYNIYISIFLFDLAWMSRRSKYKWWIGHYYVDLICHKQIVMGHEARIDIKFR